MKRNLIWAALALFEQYLDETGTDDWCAAYEATADKAYYRMCDVLADRADALRDRAKYGDA